MTASWAVQPLLATLLFMPRGSALLLTIAIVVVLALAAAIHLFGPELGRAIHGAR